MKKIVLGSLLLGLCLTLAGCGAKDASTEDTVTKFDETSEAVVEESRLAEQVQLTEKTWEASLTVGGSKVRSVDINAEVVIPNTESMGVLYLKPSDMKKRAYEILAGLSDEGVVYSYLTEKQNENGETYAEFPKWKWQYEKDKAQLYLDAHEDVMQDENSSQDLKDEYVAYQNYVQTCSKKIEDAPENGDVVTVCDEGEYYVKHGTRYYCCEIKDTALEIIGYDIEPKVQEKACKISEEAARTEAEKQLANMGLPQFGVVDVSSYTEEKEEFGANAQKGYVVVLSRDIDGVKCNVVEEVQYYEYEKNAWEQIPHITQESAFVYIDDEGLDRIRIYNIYDEVSPKDKDVKLISYNQAKEFFLSLLTQKADTYQNRADEGLSFNQLTLIYYPVEYEETYCLLPVWRLATVDTTHHEAYCAARVENEILINAIDGSEIKPVWHGYVPDDMD